MKHKVTLKSKKEKREEKIDPESEISLLICMERKKMDVQYGCLIGVCEACALKITKGKDNIEYFEEPILDIDGDIIYPCCCKIKGDIEVEKID
jgi:ferredoxin